MTDETPVQVFADGDFLTGTLTWGWQCFACREEEKGFGTATRAREGADNHTALCSGSRTAEPDTRGANSPDGGRAYTTALYDQEPPS